MVGERQKTPPSTIIIHLCYYVYLAKHMRPDFTLLLVTDSKSGTWDRITPIVWPGCHVSTHHCSRSTHIIQFHRHHLQAIADLRRAGVASAAGKLLLPCCQRFVFYGYRKAVAAAAVRFPTGFLLHFLLLGWRTGCIAFDS